MYGYQVSVMLVFTFYTTKAIISKILLSRNARFRPHDI
jgi:hypothetical protein